MSDREQNRIRQSMLERTDADDWDALSIETRIDLVEEEIANNDDLLEGERKDLVDEICDDLNEMAREEWMRWRFGYDE